MESNMSDEKFPEMHLVNSSSSGVEIRAKLSKKHDCVEFTLRDDVPQPILISPWMQFEPAELAEERSKLAAEIVRRAQVHDELIKEISYLQGIIKSHRVGAEAREADLQDVIAAWKNERAKYGKPKDFSDIDNLKWMNEVKADHPIEIYQDGKKLEVLDDTISGGRRTIIVKERS